MGTEGHGSPRDVVDAKQKHPWEVFPEDGSSAKNSEKKRKKAKKLNIKEWVKAHRLLILIVAIVTVLLIAAGIFMFIKMKESNEIANNNEPDETTLIYDFVDDFKMEDNYTSADVFAYAEEKVGKKDAIVGVDLANPDASKVEDNMNAYIGSLTSEYEKLYYRIYTMYLISKYDFPERAKFLLEEFDLEGVKMDKKQRYAYLKAYQYYYYKVENEEKEKEYTDLLNKEYVDEKEFTIDPETGKIIYNQEVLEKYKDAYKVVGGGE